MATSAVHPALVFDIETIADLTPDNRDAVTAMAAKRDQTPENYAGLCPPLARIVCISWLDLQTGVLSAAFDRSLHAGDAPSVLSVPDGRPGDASSVECLVEACDDEKHVLEVFGTRLQQHLSQPNSFIVTYSGRGFDLPVLVHRSIRHGVRKGRDVAVRAANENRFKPQMHLDLSDVVTFTGAASRYPLAAYALGYGFRSPKDQMDGSMVGEAVAAGKIVEVTRYCACDVIATAHVYRSTQS
jgi:hypothetical protein